MLSLKAASVLMLALLQSAWALTDAPHREVRRLYWELVPEMEVWVRLTPEGPEGQRPLVNLVFHAFYPGRAVRDPYDGLPAWPQGTPGRLSVSAVPVSLTVPGELSLRLMVDGRVIDLTGPESRYRLLPCLVPYGDCVPNAVEAELDPSTLQLVIEGQSVGGTALGFPFTLAPADLDAVRAFGERVSP